MMKWTVLLAIWLHSTLSARCTTPRDILVAGFYPTLDEDQRTRETLGVYPQVAAEMAVQRVNDMGFLAPSKLKMVVFPTTCNRFGDTLIAVFSSLESSNCIDINTEDLVYIGDACDEHTETIAALSSGYFGAIQISYAAQSPLLSRTDQFPYFYRTVPTYSAYGVSIYALMAHFDWLKVNTVHLETPSYTRALEELGEQLSRGDKDAEILTSFGFTSLSASLAGRIYIAMVPVELYARVLCKAFRMGLTGRLYLWILLGDLYPFWWANQDVQCTRDEMLEAVESSLIFTHKLQIPTTQQETVSGLTLEEFWPQFAQRLNNSGVTFQVEKAYRTLTSYDAIWTLALGLNKSLPILDSINSTEYALEENRPLLERSGRRVRPYTLTLHDALDQTSFTGLSGQIDFLPNRHSRVDHTTYILQMQDGEMVPIAMHDDRDGTLNVSFFGNSFRWLSGENPPRDRPALQLQGVDLWGAAIMLILTTVGIIFSVVLLVINWMYRKHKVIKASSPYINLLIISGCILGFVSVIFISIESLDLHHHIAPEAYPFLCNVRPWLLSTGFTFTFGALFAKTWRIYTIFKNPWLKKRPYKDHVLLLVVLGIFIVDCVILTVWMFLDPLDLLEKVVDTNPTLFIREVHVICAADTGTSTRFVRWIIIISAYKGLMLMFGVFLVKQTSKIKAKFFRDAKYTGIAIYGVVISCGFGVPIAFFTMFFYEEDITYFISTGTIIFCCFLTLIMVFVPKLSLLRQYNNKIPTTVLIGLNPSFRIKRNISKSQTLRSLKEKSATLKNHTNSSFTESVLNSSAATLEVTLDNVNINGWETAYDNGEDSAEVEMEEAIVAFGGIAYTAYVVNCDREAEDSYESDSEQVSVVIENHESIQTLDSAL